MHFPASSVRELARLLESANLGEISLESKGEKLTLKRATPNFKGAPFSVSVSETETEEVQHEIPEAETAEPATKIIASNWVGVFRTAKTPVEVGASVKKGQHLGAVESLKVPFDITASTSGTLAQIFVVNGQGVEWGQALFEIAPDA